MEENSCTKKTIIKITDDVFIQAEDVSSMEYEAGYENYWGNGHNGGTIVTMKSGRKIFVSNATPVEIMEKLK